MKTRSITKMLAATAISAVSMGAMTNVAEATGYENTLATSWGRTQHTFRSTGIGSARLDIRLTDQAADGNCVYVDATVRVNWGSDYTRRIGRVCGNNNSGTFSYTFRPVLGTSIRGVDVKMCREDRFRDTCVTEYNGV